MVVLDIYTQTLKTVYKTTLISKATFLVLVTTVIGLVIPFLITYNSNGFWLTHDVFYEQPSVKFRGEYLFIGLTDNISNVVVCNNFHYFKQFAAYDLCTTIKAREIDNNLDNVVDALNFQLEINLPEKETLTHFTLLLTMDYKLRTTCRLNMQSGIILQQSLAQKNGVLDVLADLKLLQKSPLMCYARRNDLVHNYPLIFNDLEVDSYRIDTIISDYNKRNISTHLEQIYTSYEVEGSDKFKLNLKVSFPEHKIYYLASIWQKIKWAWIQYVAVFVIVWWIIRRVTNYVFDNNLVLFYKVSPINKKKLHLQ